MKRFITTMGLILAIVLTAGGPATLAQKSTPEPTPLPPPTAEEKQPPPAPTPTPEPEKATPLPTPTPTSTAKPPALPTPTSEPAHPTPANTAAPRPTNTPAPAASPTPTPVTVISGLVYDDQDGDGIQGPDEAGVGGVAVTLDGQVVGATDTGGRFNLPLPGSGRALLAIVPPAGWQWMGEPLVTDEALDNVAIPLHRLEQLNTATETSTTATVAGGAMLMVLLAGLIFNGVTSLLQAVAVRSLTRTYRKQKTQEMEYRQYQVIAQRKAEIEQLLADDAGNWRQVVAQILADAVPGADTAWLAVADVSITPTPRFDVVGEDNGRYTFTISPGSMRRRFVLWRMGRAIPLDASLSLALRVEVQTVWECLAKQQNLELPLVPRRAEWYLVVREGKRDEKTRR